MPLHRKIQCSSRLGNERSEEEEITVVNLGGSNHSEQLQYTKVFFFVKKNLILIIKKTNQSQKSCVIVICHIPRDDPLLFDHLQTEIM